jgi:hypothetical protein
MSKTKKQVVITYATATTPALSETGNDDKERLHLSPAEFNAQIKRLVAETKALVKMGRKLGDKAGASIELENGEKFTAKDLNALVTTHVKTLRQLKKNYSARGRKKKSAAAPRAARKSGEGFSKGSFLEPPLISFLRSANYGPMNAEIHAAIDPLLDQGVLSRAILTPLLTTYMFNKGLRFEENGKKYFKVNPEMNKALGPYLSTAEANDTGVSKSGKARPKFNRNQFVYNRLQTIVNPGIRDKSELSAEEQAYVENQAVKDTLAEAQTVVSRANDNANN